MQTLKFKTKLFFSVLLLSMVIALPVGVLADTCSDTTTNGAVDNTKVQKCVSSTPVWSDVQNIVDFLSAGVGVIVTGVILVGGIQYTVAGDNPNALTAARKRIVNGLIALFIFLFIFAFLQWLIPGGIFK